MKTFATEKDHTRAEELNRPRRGTYATPFEAAISNSAKMANLIKDPEKMLGRFEAIAQEFPDKEIRIPFVEKILKMEQAGIYRTYNKYKDAWTVGLYAGKHFPSGHTYDGDIIEQQIFNTAYSVHRKEKIVAFKGMFGL